MSLRLGLLLAALGRGLGGPPYDAGALERQQQCPLGGPSTGPFLLQVGSRGKSEVFEEDGRAFEAVNDGSAAGMHGPPITLEEAMRALGPNHEQDLALGQSSPVESSFSNIAVVYVSGRDSFDTVLEEAVLKYTVMGGICRTNGKVPDNFIQALDCAVNRFPNPEWYYIADDDSFVHLERLGRLAAAHNASEFKFLGHRDCAGKHCGERLRVQCRRESMLAVGGINPGWACGGPGVLISRPLALAMVAGSCSDYYGRQPAPVCCGDMALACCAFDAWPQFTITDVKQLTPYPSTEKLDKASAADLPAVAVHKIWPNTTRRLGQIYNSHLAVRARESRALP